MGINLDQQKRSNDGYNFEMDIYRNINKRRNNGEYDIIKLKHKKRFYYNQKKIEECIAEKINKGNKAYSEEEIKKLIKQTLDGFNKTGNVLRNSVKYYKEADVSFMTNKEYKMNSQSTQVRFILDMTTSARTDRIKGKAQDSSVYKSLGFPYVYLIVLPNDDHFYTYKYIKNEIKQCNNAVYDANFCNVYKKDNVSLIVREKDLYNLLDYVMQNEGKDINKVLYNWKRKYYREMVEKHKKDMEQYAQKLFDKVMPLVNKSKIEK